VKLALVALLVVIGCHDDHMPDFHGIALGMTPREVRDHIDIHGAFEIEPTTDDFKMSLTPSTGATVTSAQFEFHMGALVAVRAEVTAPDAFAKGETLVVTRAAVLHRVRSGPTTHIDILARDCPTHAGETDRLLHAKAP
jgi:hypothetical protein